MKFCSSCNDTYPDDANFCLVDGTALQPSPVTGKQCPTCKRTYPLEARFCMIEGATLAELFDAPTTSTTSDLAKVNPTSSEAKTARKRKASTKSQPKKAKKPKDAELDQRQVFLQGITKWFQQMKYSVGLSTQKVETEKDLKLAKGVADVAESLLSFANPMWITGGQGSEELFQALIPYLPLCDVLGSKLQLATVSLVPVIFGDDLAASEIEQRFDQFIEMAGPLTEFGPRLNFQSQGVANIFPLVVYFDSQTFDRHLPEVLPDAWQKRIMRRIYLQASLVSVPERRVVWGERKGFFALGEKLADVLGTKLQVFEDSDIDAVLHLGQEKN